MGEEEVGVVIYMLNYCGYVLIVLSLAGSLFGAGYAWMCAWRERELNLDYIEKGQKLIASVLLLASAILLWALLSRDLSFAYVADYTDSVLPWYYALTAFWAGQKGSFLLWTLFVSLISWLWMRSLPYQGLDPENKTYFWIFFLSIQGFFLLMLCSASNPFEMLSPPVQEGNGLNPLLQHPGMIFHPPVLFLGYAGFTVPACLALAVGLTARNLDWLFRIRNWVIFSWIMLTAGIILGAWWSYMELGWGGYWAWDPVENSSLLPWLFASAFLHTSLLNRRTRSLPRTNIFLICSTLIMCFLGTFITRSGVLDSLHAFGESELGTPFLFLILTALILNILISLNVKLDKITPLSGLASKQGSIVILIWLLTAIGLVIILGTFWPVLSEIWSEQAIGVNKSFYNRVCLPLFTLIFLLLLYCPWLGWLKTKRIVKKIGILSVGGLLVACILWLGGNSHGLSLISSALALGVCISIPVYFLINKISIKNKRILGVYSVHFGLALIAVGIAFSGPFKQMQRSILDLGEELKISDYTVAYKNFDHISKSSMDIHRVELLVKKGSKKVGYLYPERRFYKNFERPFAEASVLSGIVDEIYATVLGLGNKGELRLQIRINPMVNWIWIGGILMCTMAFFTLQTRSDSKE